jgi:hypothetical protein
MQFIQRRDEQRSLETVDEFETRREAVAMLKEYQMCDPTARYYISSRSCRDWRDSETTPTGD